MVLWLPPGYDGSAERYSVLYMHDGQNLFDAATAMGGQTWGVAPHLAALQEQGAVRPTLVVGIWSTADLAREYGPAAPIEALPPELREVLLGEPVTPGGLPTLSEQYLRFLVEELKPAIDAAFRTRPARAETFIMGSSMGGRIALYALARYPQVFGAAGCVSTHWPVTTNYTMLTHPSDARMARIAASNLDWLRAKLPPAGTHKLYFDHGDVNLDALYASFQRQADAIVQAKGYRPGADWMTLAVPGDDHNELAWRARLDTPLRFLLQK